MALLPYDSTAKRRTTTGMTELKHNGQSIQLNAVQSQDGTWGCIYKILKTEAMRTSSVTGYDNNRFLTRMEAEAAARVLIDSRALLSDPSIFRSQTC